MEYKGIKINLDRDSNFSAQGKTLLEKYYAKDGNEGVQKAIARAAITFSYGDLAFAQRIYDHASQHHFFYSSPIFSNAPEGEWERDTPFYDKAFWNAESRVRKFYWRGEEPRAMPIACFLTYVGDTIEGQIASTSELSRLSVMGGGAAAHLAIRAVSEKAPGPIPFVKTLDGVVGYYRQGKTRRGSIATYLDVDHPDILEFIKIRTPSGGDAARKIDNRAGVHNAINITHKFREAVLSDSDWNLICPHTKEVRETIKARELWESILETRELTGEPYLWFIDVANEALPLTQQQLGLRNNGSNLCSEISLATSVDRTAVCCLSSVNLEKYDEWKETDLIADLVRFLDNVLQWFIDYAPESLANAQRSAIAERAIGIGAMGWHDYLMRNSIPFESGGFNSAAQKNNLIFKDMYEKGVAASIDLGLARGVPSDMVGTDRRNSHIFAIAPNSNSSILCNTSPSIEPIASNAYTQKSRAGINLVRNKHLEPVLQKYGQATEAVWKSIIDNNGSVQHLEFLSEHEKNVFKTAWEIDQHWLVDHAEARQKYICQAQSLNLFFAPGTDRAYINSVHLKAMKGGIVKSLYYFRTGAASVADTIKVIQRKSLESLKADTEGCLSCEG